MGLKPEARAGHVPPHGSRCCVKLFVWVPLPRGQAQNFLELRIMIDRRKHLCRETRRAAGRWSRDAGAGLREAAPRPPAFAVPVAGAAPAPPPALRAHGGPSSTLRARGPPASSRNCGCCVRSLYSSRGLTDCEALCRGSADFFCERPDSNYSRRWAPRVSAADAQPGGGGGNAVDGT